MKVRRVDFSPDEWLAGTLGMSPEEIGVYITICALIYSRGGDVPDDETYLSRICGCHWRTFRAIRKSLIDRGKAEILNGSWHVKRCSEELHKALRRSSEATQNAVTRWSKHRETNDLPNADAVKPRNANHQPSTTSIKENPNQEVRAKESRSRKSQVPPDWRPTDDGNRYATDHGLTVDYINSEIEKFRDYHRSKANTFADHNAAWRTWVRNVKPQKPNGKSKEPLTNDIWKTLTDEQRAEYLPGYIRPF